MAAFTHFRIFQTLPILLVLSSILPSYALSSFLTTATDTCNSILFPVSTSRCRSTDVLGDDTFYSTFSNDQCRQVCSNFDDEDYRVELVQNECDLCDNVSSNYSQSYHSKKQICIPRELCISQCGEEKPGCVYTGSCRSQICFFGSSSSKPAVFKRLTKNGPRSIITVDNSETGNPSNASATITQSQNIHYPNAIRNEKDVCEKRGTAYPLSSSSCKSSNFLIDPRGSSDFSSDQCRQACLDFNEEEYEVSVLRNTCDYCDTAEADEFEIPMGGFSAICIRRSLCIEKCGKEEPGCVYTGSCRSQICYSGIDSKKPAYFSRITHAGPRSIITVDNSISGTPSNSSEVTQTKVNDVIHFPTLLNLEESCVKRKVLMTVSSTRCDSSNALTDNRGSSPYRSNQCRVACKTFSDSNYEVTYLETRCEFCDNTKSDEYVTKVGGSANEINMCIPRNKCIENCGEERPGCVYTGSCQGMICFSGIDSKNAANFTRYTDSGEGIEILVDNDVPNREGDIPSGGGPKGPFNPGPSPTPGISTAPGSKPLTPVSSPSPEGSDENDSNSKWIWLGPIIGLIGAALAAGAAIAAACITKPRNEAQGKEVKTGETNSNSSQDRNTGSNTLSL